MLHNFCPFHPVLPVYFRVKFLQYDTNPITAGTERNQQAGPSELHQKQRSFQ